MLPDLTKYRVLTYDLIGHGETEPPEGDPTLKDLGDQLAGLLDLQIEVCDKIAEALALKLLPDRDDRAPPPAFCSRLCC